MLSQDRSMHKAVGFVAHLSEANCFVTDCAHLSPLLCSSFRCELTQRHASESPHRHLIYLPKSVWGMAELAWVWCWFLLLGTAFDLGGRSIFFSPPQFFSKGNLKILPFFSFYQSKLSLAFQHSSGMLLFPLPFRPVVFVVKSPCHSVLSVFYCSVAHECSTETWVHPSF